MKTVITAGGKGSRIASIFGEIPKPMIPVCGCPILEYQINYLREQGFDDIIITIGYLGNVVQEYFADGSKFGVNICYYLEKDLLGTAGALIALKEILTDDFFLINGDLIFDVDLCRMMERHKATDALATIATHPNGHPYDSALIFSGTDGRATRWLNKEDKRTIYKNRVNAGIHILSPEVLTPFSEVRKIDLDRDILKPLVANGKVFVYDTPEYIRDTGTPERYYEVCHDVEIGVVRAKSLCNKQRAVFLDRDGVINRYKGFIKKTDDLELLPGVAAAIKKLNRSGWLVVVVTNQPVIARGECTWEELMQINYAMETQLGMEGAYVDDIFICPHHPDKGFEGEVPEYKIECDCRKPKPGLILRAANKYNINLSDSYMVGDSLRDLDAGINAGCTPVFIGKPDELAGRVANCYDSLQDFVCQLIP